MPLRFCPTCSNLLKIEQGTSGMRFTCSTCPYIYNIMRKISTRIYYKRKEITDIIQHSSASEGMNATDVNCPRCSHSRAYFTQFQTRSADEPMTIFYKCCNRECSHTWRDG